MWQNVAKMAKCGKMWQNMAKIGKMWQKWQNWAKRGKMGHKCLLKKVNNILINIKSILKLK